MAGVAELVHSLLATVLQAVEVFRSGPGYRQSLREIGIGTEEDYLAHAQFFKQNFKFKRAKIEEFSRQWIVLISRINLKRQFEGDLWPISPDIEFGMTLMEKLTEAIREGEENDKQLSDRVVDILYYFGHPGFFDFINQARIEAISAPRPTVTIQRKPPNRPVLQPTPPPPPPHPPRSEDKPVPPTPNATPRDRLDPVKDRINPRTSLTAFQLWIADRARESMQKSGKDPFRKSDSYQLFYYNPEIHKTTESIKTVSRRYSLPIELQSPPTDKPLALRMTSSFIDTNEQSLPFNTLKKFKDVEAEVYNAEAANQRANARELKIFPSFYEICKLAHGRGDSPSLYTAVKMELLGPSFRDVFDSLKIYNNPIPKSDDMTRMLVASLAVWARSAISKLVTVKKIDMQLVHIHRDGICIDIDVPQEVRFMDARNALMTGALLARPDDSYALVLKQISDKYGTWDKSTKSIAKNPLLAPEIAVLLTLYRMQPNEKVTSDIVQNLRLGLLKTQYKDGNPKVPFPTIATYLLTGTANGLSAVTQYLRNDIFTNNDNPQSANNKIVSEVINPFITKTSSGQILKSDAEILNVVFADAKIDVYAFGGVLLQILYMLKSDAIKEDRLYRTLLQLAYDMLEWDCLKRISIESAQARIQTIVASAPDGLRLSQKELTPMELSNLLARVDVPRLDDIPYM